jgi:replicative DNA helicase
MICDKETEQAVLSAILQGNEEVFSLLEPGDFSNESHRKIFTAMLSLYEEGKPVDPVTLREKFKEEERAELGALTDALFTHEAVIPENGKHYAERLREMSERRRLQERCLEIAQKAPDSSLENLYKMVDALYKPIENNGVKRLGDYAEEVAQRLKEKKAIYGLPTGFSKLDYLLSGLQGGNLIIIASRPSVGKTALALNMALNLANLDYPVGFFSLEMSASELATRALAFLSLKDIRSGIEEETVKKLQSLPLYLSERPTLGYVELRSLARELRRKWKVQAFFLDYLQLMATPHRETRNQELEELIGKIKALARELETPFIVLSQLNRKVDGREDKKPVLSDLRDSGAIEQAADVVAFLYPQSAERVDLILAKHRNGPTGEISLTFRKEFCLFEEAL